MICFGLFYLTYAISLGLSVHLHTLACWGMTVAGKQARVKWDQFGRGAWSPLQTLKGMFSNGFMTSPIVGREFTLPPSGAKDSVPACKPTLYPRSRFCNKCLTSQLRASSNSGGPWWPSDPPPLKARKEKAQEIFLLWAPLMLGAADTERAAFAGGQPSGDGGWRQPPASAEGGHEVTYLGLTQLRFGLG